MKIGKCVGIALGASFGFFLGGIARLSLWVFGWNDIMPSDAVSIILGMHWLPIRLVLGVIFGLIGYIIVTRSMKPTHITFSVIGGLLALFIIAYFTNTLGTIGLCRPGSKPEGGVPMSLSENSTQIILLWRRCRTASAFDGKTCTQSSDCGSATCIVPYCGDGPCKNYTNQDGTWNGKGVCRDSAGGCWRIIDSFEVLCE